MLTKEMYMQEVEAMMNGEQVEMEVSREEKIRRQKEEAAAREKAEAANAYQANTNYTPAPPTKKQLETVERLCEIKKLVPDANRMTTSRDCYNYINWLYHTHIRLTEKQIETIRSLCQETGTPEPDYDTIDGSYNGEGSQLIKSLKQKVRDMADILPATENQIKTIELYNLCADIDPLSLEGLTRAVAYDFIGKNREKYTAWTKTRATAEQIKEMNRMRVRHGNEPFSYEMAIQFSQEQATAYINQEYFEDSDPELKKTTLEKPDDRLNERRIRTNKINAGEEDEDKKNAYSAMVYKLMESICQDIENAWVEVAETEDYKELITFVIDFHLDASKASDLEQEYKNEDEAMKRLGRIMVDNEYLEDELKDHFIYECPTDLKKFPEFAPLFV